MIKTYLKQLKENSTGIGSYFDMIWCTIRYGASPNNYKNFGFKELNGAQRATYVTNGLSRKIIKTFNDPAYIDIFEDKTEFAKRFSDYFGRTWISTEYLTYDAFLKFLDGKEKFIYKPVENAQGKGIQIFDNLKNPKKVYDEIQGLPGKAILEEWIVQHEQLNAVYDKAINCLRIITFCKGDSVRFLAGGVTWGNGKQIANACASGIVSPVDFESGILKKPAADFSGRVYKTHPITNANLVGIKLPYWNEIKIMLKNAAKEVPQVRYIGWDVAITPDGPILIEGNTTPGYRYYQIPVHMENKCGNRRVYESCLKE